MEQIHVTVTQDDIDNGVRCASASCPVALAIARATSADLVVVCSRSAFWMMDASLRMDRRADLPSQVYDFINAFDHERPVEPFSFSIRPEKP